MSFDIVVLQPRPDVGLLSGLEEVQEVFPLGTPEQVQKQCDLAVPGIRWSSVNEGSYRAQEGFAIEFSIADETQPSSLQLALHYGSGWETGGSASFDQMIKRFYELSLAVVCHLGQLVATAGARGVSMSPQILQKPNQD